MNIETQLRPELWAAIASSYQAGNYTHSIKDAMSVMTEALRDKSGLDLDGDALAGKALGFGDGKPPQIRINRFETETEKDEQRGFQFTVKGLYALVRNPRSHERIDDTQDTADRIILFIDYLLNFLGKSQQWFTIQDFIERITEKYFVKNEEYVQELVDTIPIRKMSDTLIAVYRAKNWGQSINFAIMIETILARLVDTPADFLGVISDELMSATNTSEVALVIRILPHYLWPRLNKMSRLRVENMLLEEFADAFYTPASSHTSGTACTYISTIAKYFVRSDSLRQAILGKFSSSDFDQHNFVARYLMSALQFVFNDDDSRAECVAQIAYSVKWGNEFMKNALVRYISQEAPPKWAHDFAEQLQGLTDPEHAEIYLPDGTPFLGKFVAASNPIDDMPSDF